MYLSFNFHYARVYFVMYSLLMELTLPSLTLSLHSEFRHSSVEEAYEAAIHSVHSPARALQSLWMEYLLYLRSRALEEDDMVNFDNFKAFLSAVHRCVMAIDHVQPLPCVCPNSSQAESVHEDYSFHDQVMNKYNILCMCTIRNMLLCTCTCMCTVRNMLLCTCVCTAGTWVKHIYLLT